MTSQETTKMTLKPLGNRVLTQRLKKEENIKGGIILPDSVKKEQEIAVVISVGSIKDKDGNVQPFPVQAGDRVLMDKYSGQEIELEGEKFVIVKSDDIVAIVN
jgi:chaperonin GroES